MHQEKKVLERATDIRVHRFMTRQGPVNANGRRRSCSCRTRHRLFPTLRAHPPSRTCGGARTSPSSGLLHHSISRKIRCDNTARLYHVHNGNASITYAPSVRPGNPEKNLTTGSGWPRSVQHHQGNRQAKKAGEAKWPRFKWWLASGRRSNDAAGGALEAGCTAHCTFLSGS